MNAQARQRSISNKSSAQSAMVKSTDSVEIHTWRSVIAHANYNVPAYHATRLRGTLTEPVVTYLDRGR